LPYWDNVGIEWQGGERKQIHPQMQSCCWSFLESHTEPLPSVFVSDREINTKSLLMKYLQKGRRVNIAERLAEITASCTQARKMCFTTGKWEGKARSPERYRGQGSTAGNTAALRKRWRSWCS